MFLLQSGWHSEDHPRDCKKLRIISITYNFKWISTDLLPSERKFFAIVSESVAPYCTSPSMLSYPLRWFPMTFKNVEHPEPGRPSTSSISPGRTQPLVN